MIIKDKPFHILSAQFIQCAYFYPAGVLGCATRPYGVCTLDYMRRFSNFVKLEAYQVRLSRYLVMRRSDAVFDRGLDRVLSSPAWLSGVWSDFDDYLIHVGGVA